VLLVRHLSPSEEASEAPLVAPVQSLVSFARLHDVVPREVRQRSFELSPSRIFTAFRGMERDVPRGRYSLRVGDVEAPALVDVELLD
jgi:hypothetical protein